ncbi:hypothetical protein LQZ18_01590 [Lachnospiraceae bacterium ZAX-1]
MIYSYDPTKIKEQGKDRMRFEIGDTLVDGGTATCALSDEEYIALLDGIADGRRAWLSAKLAVLEAILFKLSYQVDTKIDVLSYAFGKRAEQWKALYDMAKKEASAAASTPSMVEGKVGKPPYFYTGMEENCRAGCGEVSYAMFRKMME